MNNERYFNRDISWLRFNHRVLQEAADTRNPILERLNFLAIYASNMDEFFEVRVSKIRQIKQLDKPLRKRLITKPNRLLKAIIKEVQLQHDEIVRLNKETILPELAANGLHLITEEEFTETQATAINAYYEAHLKEHVSIERCAKSSDGIFLENEELYLMALCEDDGLILCKIPNQTDRFVVLESNGDKHAIVFKDAIISYVLQNEYNTPFYSIKVSRDAELYIEDEYSGNLLQKIADSLKNRETGQITRALVEESIPKKTWANLRRFFDISKADVVKGFRYNKLQDLFTFPNPSKKQLNFSALPAVHSSFAQQGLLAFESIAAEDQFLCFPYEAFDPVIDLICKAAGDSSVKRIWITLYRVSKDSAIAKALESAAQQGKEVYVFIETKARFDEANNIKWGKRLEAAGAQVMYSYPGIKVHSKILYIERIENEQVREYAYIGTGNFNEKSAQVYTDFALITADKKICKELKMVFRVLQGKSIAPSTKRLLISPFSSRKGFTKLIEKEKQKGSNGYIFMKMNSLEDREMIELLYAANNAGVQIDLLVRGICCLVPGIPEQSERITVRSIVDRFLEHGRVYCFGKTEQRIFIGSADLMTRNLDHRIEVITPINSEAIKTRIMSMMNMYWNDEVKARIIDKDQLNHYVSKLSNEPSAQVRIHDLLKSNAEIL